MNTTCSTENSDEEIRRADERGEGEERGKEKGGRSRADERGRRVIPSDAHVMCRETLYL